MKLHANRISHLNAVTAYGEGFVEINGERHGGALLVQPEGPVQAWAVTGFESLQEPDFGVLEAMAPEVLLLGTGARQRFLHPRLTARLAQAGVGVETMDSGAACRTFNLLASEGRKVVLALLPG